MISVFFNEDGYYVAGEGIEISRRCSPALTTNGDKIFQPIHHSYKVLYLALCELRDMSVVHDIVVYNDSRIIDEINGTTDQLDSTCKQWLQILRRNTIPSVKSLVLFRKKPTNHINTAIANAHSDMLSQLNAVQRLELAVQESKTLEKQAHEYKRAAVDRLKKSWFGDNTDG